MANRITTIIDFVTTGAQRSVQTFRQSVAQADGAVNKFKAGTSSAMTTLQANAGTLALAGGAALATFGTKAVAAFQDTAIAAGKFSDATGLAVEDASRLIEVAGDVGVGASTIEAAIVRMNAAAAKGDLEKFGVEIQRAADGTTDVNATFLETIRVLDGIEDPTERALAAQKIFGRGYKEAAEIIFDSAGNVAQKLGEVSEQKVINEDELRKAREFRESMDNLNDALDDIQLAAGEALVPLVGGLADVTLQAREAKGAIEDMIPGDTTLGGINRGDLGAFGLFVDAVTDVKDAFDGSSDSGGLFRGVIAGMLPEINEAGNVVGELGDEVAELGPRWSAANIPLEAASGNFAELTSEADRAADAVESSGDAADEAAGHFNVFEEGLQKAGDSVNFLTSELNKLDEDLRTVELLADIDEQFQNIAESADDQEGEIRTLVGMVADYVGTLENLPTEKVTEIISVLRRGDVDEIRTLLDDLTKDRFVNITVVPKQSAFESLNAAFSAGVAPSAPVFNQPNPAPAGNTVINYFPVGSTPTTTNQDLLTYYNRNGIR